jgi:hypothetical protein
MTKKTSKGLATKARRHLKARADGSACYSRADRLLREMREAGMKPGDAVTINAKGERVVLLDLYADSDKVFRSHGIGRFELKLIPAGS